MTSSQSSSPSQLDPVLRYLEFGTYSHFSHLVPCVCVPGQPADSFGRIHFHRIV
jgi:hypothetical protein